MASTYGVTYSTPPKKKTSLSSLYGGYGMLPASSARPAAGIAPVSDVLNSAQQAAAAKLSAIAPTSTFSGFGGAPPDARQGGDIFSSPGAAAPTAPAGAPSGTDLTADPILQQIKALGQRSAQDANSSAAAQAKAQLINYGGSAPQSLRDLFSAAPVQDSILGDLGPNAIAGVLNDQGTADAANANPFGTLQQLGQAHDANVHNLDNASNLNNLFYSSTHANQLGDEATNYLGAQNNAANNLASLLSGDNQGVLSAVDSAHQQYLSGLSDSYNRALATAAAANSDGGYGPDPNAPVDPNAPQGSGGSWGSGPDPLAAQIYAQAHGGTPPPSQAVIQDPNYSMTQALADAATLRQIQATQFTRAPKRKK